MLLIIRGAFYRVNKSPDYSPGLKYKKWKKKKIMALIGLAEYAKRHKKNISSVRRKTSDGGFSTAKKIGRN